MQEHPGPRVPTYEEIRDARPRLVLPDRRRPSRRALAVAMTLAVAAILIGVVNTVLMWAGTTC